MTNHTVRSETFKSQSILSKELQKQTMTIIGIS